MAAPAYSNDLTTIATGDLNYDTGTWSESGDAGWDTAGSMVDDENLQYTENSTNTGEATDSCTSQQYTKDGSGSGTTGPGTVMYTHTAAFTVPTDGVVLIDNLWAAPSALNVYAGTFLTAEAGVSVLIGDDADNFDVHYVSGSDLPPAPKGGWTTYAVDPTITPAGTVGTVSTTTTVGTAIAAVAQARGNPHACQSVRYGRAEAEYTIGDATTPATFTGYASIDNAAADRFNLLEIIPGGYQARGLMTFGTATVAVYFKDSDKSIVIADDLKVGTAFNKGVVNHAGSELYWTNISITNLGTVALYTFTVNNSATTEHAGCVFQDLGAFNYGSNSTNTNTTYRRQALVSQLGATFTGCTFDSPAGTVGLLISSLNIVTDCTFTSDGTGHGVNLGTIAATISLNWDNFESGYTAASSGDETILVSVDSGQTLTINVQPGASTPSVYNTGLGYVAVVSGQATASFNVIDEADNSAIAGASVTIKVSTVASGLPFEESVTITSTGGTATVSHTGHGIADGKKVAIDGADQNEYNRIKTITLIDVDSYSYVVSGTPTSPATGTITATAVIIDGVTDTNGDISDTRSYGVNQPFTGLIQQGTGTNIYKARTTSGIIFTDSGASQTILLTKD